MRDCADSKKNQVEFLEVKNKVTEKRKSEERVKEHHRLIEKH